MPKSKRSVKRRKKVKNRNKTYFHSQSDDDGSFDKDYMKTDGEGRVMKFNKHHAFLGYANEEESKNF